LINKIVKIVEYKAAVAEAAAKAATESLSANK